MPSATNRRLDEAIRARLRRHARAIAIAPAQLCPHQPHPKQAEFLGLDGFEALYGGAAGGGKTDALLMGAAQYVHVPGYAAIILRRKFTDMMLPDGILTRAIEWWAGKPGIHWDPSQKTFTFPSRATISFGYCDSATDHFRYQGAAVQFLGIDELTQWPESRYRYLLSRIRKPTGMPVPLRARATSNPGGIGHDWVFGRFVDPTSVEGAFVPALAKDNPSLDLASYLESLSRLDSVTRRQLEHGEWIPDGRGLVYSGFAPGRNLIDALPSSVGQAPWQYRIGLDFGIVDPNALTVVAWRRWDPIVYVVRSYQFHGNVADMAEEVARLAADYPPERIIADEGGMGKAFTADLHRKKLSTEPASKADKVGHIKLLNADLERARVKIVRAGTDPLVREWRSLAWHESGLRESGEYDNHCSDSLLYVWHSVPAYIEETRQEPGHWDVEAMREQYEATGQLPKGVDLLELQTLEQMERERQEALAEDPLA